MSRGHHRGEVGVARLLLRLGRVVVVGRGARGAVRRGRGERDSVLISRDGRGLGLTAPLVLSAAASALGNDGVVLDGLLVGLQADKGRKWGRVWMGIVLAYTTIPPIFVGEV